MTKFLPFYLDSEQFFQNDKSFMITGEKLAFLTGFLNSSLFKFCFMDNFPELQGGTRELRKIFIDKIPVIKVDDDTNRCFQEVVNKIQQGKTKGVDTRDLEVEIDRMIFDLYSLSTEERSQIGFIEIV